MTKAELIDKHREINVNYDGWWESVYEWFEEQCRERGVNLYTRQETSQHGMRTPTSRMVPDIVWSGFWSQGDGAAFGGHIHQWAKFLGDQADRYPMFSKYAIDSNGWVTARWVAGRHNSISNFDFNVEPFENYLEDDHPFAEIWQEGLDAELDSVEALVLDSIDDLCYLLYNTLRDEYEALTSDEAVWETIVANELDKENEDVE